MRNDPKLNRWFRQEHIIELEAQIRFMKHYKDYHGYIIQKGKKPVGIVANYNGELCIVAPERYHAPAIAHLEVKEKPPYLWGEVFVSNPNLATYLSIGFKAVAVKSCAYHKKGHGWQDVVRIEKYVH